MSESWVCSECGLDYDTLTPGGLAAAVRSFPDDYQSLLLTAGEDVRRRPDQTTWSALEYSAHVGDVFEALEDCLRRMAEEDQPTIDIFDSDVQAAEQRYNEQEVAGVLARLEANATTLAALLSRLGDDAWSRTARFDWGERDLLTMARNAVHEGHHHRHDIHRVLASVQGA